MSSASILAAASCRALGPACGAGQKLLLRDRRAIGNLSATCIGHRARMMVSPTAAAWPRHDGALNGMPASSSAAGIDRRRRWQPVMLPDDRAFGSTIAIDISRGTHRHGYGSDGATATIGTTRQYLHSSPFGHSLSEAVAINSPVRGRAFGSRTRRRQLRNSRRNGGGAVADASQQRPQNDGSAAESAINENLHREGAIYEKLHLQIGGRKNKSLRKKGKQQQQQQKGARGAAPPKKKSPPRAFEHRTHSDTGRPIMTKDRLQSLLDRKDYRLAKDIDWTGGGDGASNPKSVVHNAKLKMGFQLKYEPAAEEGRGHDKLFFATSRVTLDRDVVTFLGGLPLEEVDNAATGDAPAGAALELVNVGAARTKKQAEGLAASDLIMNLAELGINARNLPDLAKMRQKREKEMLKTEVQRAQMILEVLNVSRPVFENTLVEKGKRKGTWESEVRFYCRGAPIRASSVDADAAGGVDGGGGRSKAESEGRALAAAVLPGGVLESFVGKRRMDWIRGLVEASPAGHVAALHVPALPDEALDVLGSVLGTEEEQAERHERHMEMKAEHEWRFREQRSRRGRGAGRGPSRGADLMSDDMRAEINEAFAREERARAERAAEDPEGRQGVMKSVRDALPIKKIRDGLIDALKCGQVVVVSGGTGSGKSTQCPQYILEDAIAEGRGASTRIVVTQPRRIAAISVAERVAAERDEKAGNSVGYTVRFNRRTPRESGGSIEFVTTGILLRRLVSDPSLDGVSHVMIDEVHERDIDTDFLLVLLRELLDARPDLRVVLMSATLDAESFGRYFSSSRGGDADDEIIPPHPVPVMSVPTKPRHPVEVVHLEDFEGATGETKVIPTDVRQLAHSLLRLHDQQLQVELEAAIAEEAAASRLERRSMREDEGDILDSDDSESSDSDSDSDDSDDSDDERAVARPSRSPMRSNRLEALRRAVSMRGGDAKTTLRAPRSPGAADHRLREREIGEMTTRLLAKIAQHVVKEETDAGRKGSVLCFLPGLDEIKEAMAILVEESKSSLRSRMKILPLHSTIPQDDQQKVFVPAADGTVKVILATNIAESSVTIDDVLAVVDGGLVRELNWDAEKSMSTMVTVPTSKASATQRLGRAGRVAPGKCYRIYSRGQHAAMLERPMPEIQRTALEATCLNTCTLTDDSVSTFLSRAMDPPKEEAVAHSMNRLKKLGAITFDQSSTGGETLTPLGHSLSRLPLDPAMGRMLIMGCVLQCLDPVLTAAACLSSREVFFTPPGMREEQRQARKGFSEHSDMMSSIRAYNAFQDIQKDEGWDVARGWAADNFVSIHALNSIRSTRSQLVNELNRIGLVDNSDLVGYGGRNRGRNKQLRPDASVNRNAQLELLHSAVWSCGLPDNLASRRQLGSFGTLRTRSENHAELHPSSVAFHRKPPKDKKRHQLPPWFFYREMVLSSQVFLRGCTALTPEQILLFGGYSLESSPSTNGGYMKDNTSNWTKEQKVLDDWIAVEGACDDTLNMLVAARREINAALDMKVMNPRVPLSENQQELIDAVCYCFDVLDNSDEGDF